MAEVFTALVHFPVYNKNREVVTSALTTIDLHDLARLAATYGLAGLYIVTPLADQRLVAEEMLEHWCRGWGADYNPNRAEALSLVRVVDTLGGAAEDIRILTGEEPLLVATSAANGAERTTFARMKPLVEGETPMLITFGTAWGMTEEALGTCDLWLEPVKGPTEYNHLSVRSAAGIILDRLFGQR